MGLFGRSRADKLGQAIDIAGLREDAAMQDPSYMPPAPKPGAFGHGGMGWQILGAIGDGLSQMGGYGAPFAQARNQQRQQQLEEAQWTRRQQSELAQRKAMYDYELAHPKPPAPNDTERDFDFLVRTYGPDQAKQMYRDHYSMRWVQDAMGQWRQVGPQQPQTAPPGVTFTPLDDGGPTQPASEGFPRR